MWPQCACSAEGPPLAAASTCVWPRAQCWVTFFVYVQENWAHNKSNDLLLTISNARPDYCKIWKNIKNMMGSFGLHLDSFCEPMGRNGAQSSCPIYAAAMSDLCVWHFVLQRGRSPQPKYVKTNTCKQNKQTTQYIYIYPNLLNKLTKRGPFLWPQKAAFVNNGFGIWNIKTYKHESRKNHNGFWNSN